MTSKFLISPPKNCSYSNIRSTLKSCLNLSKTLIQLKQTHSFLLKASITQPHHHYHRLLSIFLIKLLRLPGDIFSYAHQVFDEIPNCQDPIIWTSIIRSHVVGFNFTKSIALYAQMHRVGVPPSGFTFSVVLNACARIPTLIEGQQIHGRLIGSGLGWNKCVQTSLLDVYAKCGLLVEARVVFDEMADRDVVAWTTMICGYSKKGMMDDAQRLFDNMGERNVMSWSTMVAGYTKWGDMCAAKKLYDAMPEKHSVAWVAMIAGYAKRGDVSSASRVFDEIPMEDATCCAAMIACYAQNGYSSKAIGMFNQMREKNMRTSEVAVVGAVSACGELGDVEMAAALDNHVNEGGCDRTPIVSSALIHMHAKCGNLNSALKEFNRMSNKDVISYGAVITALAEHGRSQEALDLFSAMQQEGIRPNEVTFVGVLNACSHAGLMEEGCNYFRLMTEIGIKPLTEHCACMVDLFGRDGQIEKAYKLITDNVSACNAGVWGALLGACGVHGNVELGEIAAQRLFVIEPENAANYALLGNIYASVNRWEDAERVRKMMTENRMRKPHGCSWISTSLKKRY